MGDHSKTMMAATASVPSRGTSGVSKVALSFSKVYEDHFDFVWRTARRLGIPDAALDDVAQEVFIVVHRKLPEFEGRSSVKTWLYAIARRVVSDHRRRHKRRGPLHTPFPEDRMACSDMSPQEQAARQEAAVLLHGFLASLPDEQREVFVLAELEQMTAPEIGEATGVKLNTVYSRLRLARKAFERVVARQAARRRTG
ncbi:MAG: sigma-70 family RNA polymerase sigma factor [Myxococcota bacterium]